MTATLHLPDVSEFQHNVDWKKVAAHNGGAAIIRVFNGNRVDRAWFGGDRRRQAHADGIRALGLYLYLVPTRSYIKQAKDFIALVHKLQPGEFVVVDFEDPGDHHTNELSSIEALLSYLDHHLTYPGYHGAWLYSYASYERAHHVDAIFRSNRHTWLAAYQTHEPATPLHTLWQHADAEAWPGIGHCDCSIFHGDVAAFEARIWTRPDKQPHPAAAVQPSLVDHGRAPAPLHRPAPVAKPAPVATHGEPVVVHAPQAPVRQAQASTLANPAVRAWLVHSLHAVSLGLTSFLGTEAVVGGHYDAKAWSAAAVAALRLALSAK